VVVADKVVSNIVGFFSVPDFLEVGSDSLDASSSGAATLGERLRFSLPIMSECGAPIYLSESKSVKRFHRRSKVGICAQKDVSLFTEVVMAISAPTAQSLGASGWDRGPILVGAR
jgi:hypothetical protein